MSSLKKKDKTQRRREARKPKSIFVTITKKIHAINLQERLLKVSYNGSRKAKNPSSNSPNGRVGPTTLSNSPIWGVGPITPSNSPIWRVGPTTFSNSPIWRVGRLLAHLASWTDHTVQLAYFASWKWASWTRPHCPTRPFGELDRSQPSNSSDGRVGPTTLPSCHSRSFLFCDRIELTLVSSRSESSSELYNLETAKNSFTRRKFGFLV